MPEGDTIYRTARALQRALGGKVVTGFEAGVAKLASLNDDVPVVVRVGRGTSVESSGTPHPSAKDAEGWATQDEQDERGFEAVLFSAQVVDSYGAVGFASWG